LGYAVTQTQILLHRTPPQVEVAIRKPYRFGQIGLIQLKRQRLGAVQHLNPIGNHFNLARGQMGILRSRRSRPDSSFDAQDKLRPYRFGDFECLGIRGIKDRLRQTQTIAQIDKNDATVVTAALGPAGKRDVLPDERVVQVATIMTAKFHLKLTNLETG